jgi:hypothetical protein
MKAKIKLLIGVLIALSAILIFTSLKIARVDTKDLVGAWEYGPAESRAVMINTDKIFSVAVYDAAGKKFIHAYGGKWRVAGNKLIKNIEWDSKTPDQVGKEIIADITIAGGKLTISGSNEKWSRVDNGRPGELPGAWIITGNYANDKVNKRPNPFYPRRTMKVLSGTRFHWIAYNVQAKQFMNAGGGTYTANNGNYTENIEFFTKTPESIGKTVAFKYSFIDGDWRHKGEKSTGGPLDECWSKRETLEK